MALRALGGAVGRRDPFAPQHQARKDPVPDAPALEDSRSRKLSQGAKVMAQTFDIRFANSAGLAGLFEAPANEYRWKGAGRLSIDATGISIAARRGLLTLFSRATTRRIPTDDLLEVYREGNALRLEFSTQESQRTVLPIWLGDRDAAAEIVTLLPTQRSVELEEGDPASRRYRFDRRLVALLLIAVATLGIGTVVLQRYLAVDRITPRVEVVSLPAPPAAPVAQIAPEIPAPIDTPAETAPKYLLSPIAREEFRRFQAESRALHAEYSSMRAEPTAEGLESLEARWQDVTVRIYDNENFEGIEFVAQRELELAISRSWRYYFSIHAAGLRAEDPQLVELATTHLAFAEALDARLSQFAR